MGALPALGFTPGVGDLPFTPEQRSLLSLVNELGRTRIAARAAQWDRELTTPAMTPPVRSAAPAA